MDVGMIMVDCIRRHLIGLHFKVIELLNVIWVQITQQDLELFKIGDYAAVHYLRRYS